MKVVVVGGQSRNVGKTSVVAGIVAALARFQWTAVKITQFGHGVCSRSGEPCACSATEPGCEYAIEEERDATGRSDTSRFLQAGARRVLWVRTAMGQLAAAMPALLAALGDDAYVILESNSVVEFLHPDVYLTVLDPAVEDFKVSARRFLDLADACLVLDAANGDANRSRSPAGKPVYRVRPGAYVTPEVVAFVESALAERALA